MFSRIPLAIPFVCATLLSNIRAEEAKPADAPKLDAQLKDVKKQITLVIKKTVKMAEIKAALAEIYPKVYKFLEANKIKASSAPMAKYKVVGETFEMEAGVVVPDGTKGEGDIVISDLPEGKVGFVNHIGPYEKLSKTYEALSVWLKTKAYTSTGIGWEIYVDPGQKTEEPKTEVYLVAEPEKK